MKIPTPARVISDRRLVDVALKNLQRTYKTMKNNDAPPPIKTYNVDSSEPVLFGTAYATRHQIVICGIPPDEDPAWPDDDERRHNCDQMMCGSEHVLARFTKPDWMA